MRLADVVAASSAVAGTSGRLEKVAHLADVIRRVPSDEIETVIGFLSGDRASGADGIGCASLSGCVKSRRLTTSSLDIRDVDAAFDRLAASSGAGSASRRAELLRELFRQATHDEQDFLLPPAVRRASAGRARRRPDGRGRQAPLASRRARIRRAAMLAGDLAPVARAALVEGEDALSRFVLQPFQPVQPMLADSASDVDGALDALGEASFEYKLDGARIQVHKVGDEVRVYTRNLRDVTSAVPEVVTAARAMPARELVLDGEVIALRAERHAAAVSGSRCGASAGSWRSIGCRRELPITPFFFDALYVDGDRARRRAAVAARARARRAWLAAEHRPAAGDGRRRRLRRRSPARALAAGHEGVMAKARRRPVRRRPARRGLAEGEAGAHAGPGHPRGGVGQRPPPRHAQQPPPRRARSRARRLRDARQDVQGADRRDAGVADEEVPRARDRPRRLHRLRPARGGRRRSRSTRFRRARSIRAVWRCASRA